VIAHEIAHALGFFHETSRPDRDDFVEILLINAHLSEYDQFLKEQPEDIRYYSVPYDYGSLMHYSGTVMCFLGCFWFVFTFHGFFVGVGQETVYN